MLYEENINAKMKFEKLVQFVISLGYVCFFTACVDYSRQVRDVLLLSGDNRHELEKVLEHYRDSTLKFKAACFLIENMVGFSVPDSASLSCYQPLYHTCDSLRKLHRDVPNVRIVKMIDSLWRVYPKKQSVKYVPMWEVVTAKQLIAEIEIAFRAWKENAFTRDYPFESFCEYILPFCRGRNFVLDDSRLYFNQLYRKKFYVNNRKSILMESDSLLYLYKNIFFSTFYQSGIPILSSESLLQIGGGRCPERSVFNTLLFSALGVPVTIDFVPAWGNGEDSHSWNVLVTKDSCYAFDPFWNEDNWRYNRLYSNTGVRDFDGRVEFWAPKIYRRTYSTHLETTLIDKEVPLEDIPPLFRDFKKIDVSSEYFETTDVKINLRATLPKNTDYAYLSVYGSKGWVPVQVGKIEEGEALFHGMGRNIVYLPVYYRAGNVLPAAHPFLLTKSGNVRSLEMTGELEDSVVIRNVAPEHTKNWRNLDLMTNAFIVGCKGESEDTLCQLSPMLPVRNTVYKSDLDSQYRFFRLYLPTKMLALSELSFYAHGDKIRGARIISHLDTLGQDGIPDYIFDNFTSTAYRGLTVDGVVEIDLGKEYPITSIVFSPYMYSHIYANSSYELMYWKNGWKSLDLQKGGKDDLVFRNVPRNVLLRLKQSTKVDRKIKERIFLYEDGEVIWM